LLFGNLLLDFALLDQSRCDALNQFAGLGRTWQAIATNIVLAWSRWRKQTIVADLALPSNILRCSHNGSFSMRGSLHRDMTILSYGALYGKPLVALLLEGSYK
jgi:hypothetical protein